LRLLGWPLLLYWFAELAVIALVVLVPQGMRLWWPRAFVQHYLPHTLTTAELRLLVKIAGGSALAGALLGSTFLRRRS
jgi:hypothetical protein